MLAAALGRIEFLVVRQAWGGGSFITKVAAKVRTRQDAGVRKMSCKRPGGVFAESV